MGYPATLDPHLEACSFRRAFQVAVWPNKGSDEELIGNLDGGRCFTRLGRFETCFRVQAVDLREIGKVKVERV